MNRNFTHAKDFSWFVYNFREMPEDVDYAENSPAFPCGGVTWYMRLYPNGKSSEGSEGRMGLTLVRVQPFDEHRVQYTLGFMKSDCRQVFQDFAGNHTYDEDNLESGGFQFENRNTAQSQVIRQTGEVMLFCRIRIPRYVAQEANPFIEQATNESIRSLQQDYLRLLRSENFSDLIFNVRGIEFKAHRAIVKARSPAFASLLSNAAVEKGIAIVTIDDCDYETFPDFLQYMYTARVETLSEGNVYSLYKTASVFNMWNLKIKCVQHMKLFLSVNNFCDVMTLALEYEEQELKEVATHFFVINVARIIVAPKWFDFLTKNCKPANDLFIAAVSNL